MPSHESIEQLKRKIYQLEQELQKIADKITTLWKTIPM